MKSVQRKEETRSNEREELCHTCAGVANNRRSTGGAGRGPRPAAGAVPDAGRPRRRRRRLGSRPLRRPSRPGCPGYPGRPDQGRTRRAGAGSARRRRAPALAVNGRQFD